MKLLHLSSIENRDSILKNGLLPADMLKLVTTVKTRRYKNDTIGVSYSKNL